MTEQWLPRTAAGVTHAVDTWYATTTDRIRLWKEGIRDLVMELCCALHNFRVRLTPWQPRV